MEQELLKQLLDYYTGKYPGQDGVEKFHDMADDLVKTGDVQRTTYIKFCISNNVDPRVPKVVKKTKPSSYSSDPCGGGGYTRSSC